MLVVHGIVSHEPRAQCVGSFDHLAIMSARIELPMLMLRDRLRSATQNATHATNIVDYIRALNEPRFAMRFGFACEPSFGINWRVPRGVLTHLLESRG